MRLLVSTALDEVRRLAVAAVSHDPVRHTVFGSIAATIGLSEVAPFAAHRAGADLPLVVRGLPRLPVQFSVGWDDGLEDVAAALAVLDPPVVAVSGPVDTVDAVATALGRPVVSRSGERLFRLDELTEPVSVSGFARLADADDLELVLDWFRAFALEAFGRVEPGLDAFTRDRIAAARTWLWIDAHGQPRAMAVRQREDHGAARIGPVYTPPEHRRLGYGTSVTAAATRDILDAGAVPCLFTQLSNATSNRIYQAIGYVPVMDRATLRFDS